MYIAKILTVVYQSDTGDLTISVHVLFNYLENNTKIPWEDLRYLFGEIMYGGHITDDWDRRLCRTYLQEYLVPELVCKIEQASYIYNVDGMCLNYKYSNIYADNFKQKTF